MPITNPGRSPRRPRTTIQFEANKNLKQGAYGVFTPKGVVNQGLAVGKGYNLLDGAFFQETGLADYPILNYTGVVTPYTEVNKSATSIKVVTESSLSKLQKSFDTKVGMNLGLGLFKASFQGQYKDTVDTSVEKLYSKVMVFAQRKRYVLSPGWEKLLHPDFYRDLNTASVTPAALFKKYGTHLILNCYYGGNMDLSLIDEKKSHDTSSTYSTSLHASLNEKKEKAEKSTQDAQKQNAANGGASGDVQLLLTLVRAIMEALNKQEAAAKPDQGSGTKPDGGSKSTASFDLACTDFTSSNEKSNRTQFEGHTCGGNGVVPANMEGFSDTLAEWLTYLLEEKNWALCGIEDKDDLYPIWEMCDSSSRKAQIKEYYDQVAKQNTITPCERYVTDLKIAYGDDEGDALAMARSACKGYTRVPLNLNEGAGMGAVVYLCYKGETKEQMRVSGNKPITNLAIFLGDKYMKSTNTRQNMDRVDELVDAVELEVQGVKAKYTAIRPKLSEGISASKVRHTQLCYTRDEKYAPITAISAYSDDASDFMKADDCEWMDVPSWYDQELYRCSTLIGLEGENDPAHFIIMMR